jgi:hypothetical protein
MYYFEDSLSTKNLVGTLHKVCQNERTTMRGTILPVTTASRKIIVSRQKPKAESDGKLLDMDVRLPYKAHYP